MRACTVRRLFLRVRWAAFGAAASALFGLLPVLAEAKGQPLSVSGALSSGQPTYTWSAASDASDYMIAVDTAAGEIRFRRGYRASAVCGDGICSATPWNTLPLGNYVWYVLSVYPDGDESWSGGMAFSVALQPATLLSPAGATSEPRPPFVWQPVPDATYYTLAIDTVEGQLVRRQTLHTSQVCSGARCSFTVSSPLTNGSYVWYVQPSSGGGAGPWSAGLRFDVAPLSAPTPNAPAGYQATRQPTYAWTAVSGATGYLLMVDDATPTPIVRRHLAAAEACGPSSCAFTPAAVLEPGVHNWYVSAWNDAGEGALSAGSRFVTPGWSGAGYCAGTSAAGDFDGDGRTDRLCSEEGVTNVSLATDSGSAPAAVWLDREIGAPIVADFNGDGKADLAEYDGASASVRVGLSSGGSFAHLAPWGQVTASWAGESYSCTRPVLTGVGNFDGNGLPDFYCQGGPSSMIFVGKNNGSGFGFSIFADYSCWGVYERSGPADFDGDGRDDWSCIDGNGGVYARLNDGASFEELSFQGLGSGFCEQDKILFTDLNADGRTDVTCASTGAVALSTGAALLDQGAFGAWCQDAEARLAPLDVDGDGVSELLCTHAGGPGSDVMLRRWDGSSLSPPMLVQAGWCGGAVLGGDFDGNGRSELRCHDGRALPGSDGSPPADLMVEATSELGGRTTVSYVPSSHFPTANNPPVRPLVAALTGADGRGASSTTTFSYEGAKVDRMESEALGFGRIRVTSPCLAGEAQCPYSDTWYSQDRPSAGLATRVERRDGAGRLHQATSHTYAAALGPPRRAALTRLETTDFGPSGDSRTTATTYRHDAFGNITQTLALGDLASSGDELQTDVTMADPDLERYIVDRPRLIERREPGGDAVTSEERTHDSLGRPIQVKRLITPATGSRSFVERSVAYGTGGNPTSITNERGGVTTVVYDADGVRPESVTSPANETTVVDWHSKCEAPASTMDANGQVTTNEYDALCRPTMTVLPPNAQGEQGFTLRSYLDFGDPSSQRVRVEAPGTNGNDFAETYFDGFERSYRGIERGPAGRRRIVATRSWNERGGLATASAPFYEGEAADMTTYTYDAFDRLVTVGHPDGSETGKAYGLWTETTTDANGRSATVSTTATTSETRSRIDGQEVVTTSQLDPLGRLVSLTDALGNAWSWTYDSVGRVVEQTDPDSGRTGFSYDEATGSDVQIDAMGLVTTLRRDPAGRLVSRRTAAGTTTYSYGTAAACPAACNLGRLVDISFAGTLTAMDYDALGRVVRLARTLDGVEYTVQREYDAAGRLRRLLYPDGDSVGPMSYDEAGRIVSIPGILESVSYDAGGRPLDQRNANGTLTTRRYWPQRGLPQLVHTSGPNGTIQQLEYTQYDPVGLLKKLTSAVDGESWEYGYDDGYRLTTATNLPQPSESQSFAFDVIGRITTSSRYGAYSYPSAGEAHPHAPTAVNGIPLSYDPNGNTLAAGTRRLVWNADNLVTQVTLGTLTTSFAYDGVGERVKKSSVAGESLYPFGDDYEITDGVVTKYVTVDGLGVLAKHVAGGPAPGTYWLHTDRQGSIQAVTDASGSVVFRRTYRPYGETLAEGGTHPESRGWIDQRNDRETGLTYLHARYYDPVLRVFMNPDPAQTDLNTYRYSHGDSVNRSDRSGLCDSTAWVPNDSGTGGEGGWLVCIVDVVHMVGAGDSPNGSAAFDRMFGRFGGQLMFVQNPFESLDGTTGTSDFEVAPLAAGLPALTSVVVPGTDGLRLGLNPRGWVPKSGSTSSVFIQNANGKIHLRLDNGFNVKTGRVEVHWNQKGTFGIFGTPNHTPAGAGGVALHRAASVLRVAGRASVGVGVVTDSYQIATSEDPLKSALTVGYGWTTAYAGAQTLGSAGAYAGAPLGPGGVVVGGLVGGMAGGAAGYWGGTQYLQWLFGGNGQ